MATEKRLMIEFEVARNATYEEVWWTASEQAYVRSFLAKLPKEETVEVVHGRWKVSRESEISRNVWCTACGEDFYMHRKGELQIDKMPYCPNCGAKMDGDGDEIH